MPVRMLPYCVSQRFDAPVVHVGRRHGDIAQARRTKMPEMSDLALDLCPRCGGPRAVVVASEPIEAAFEEPLRALGASGIAPRRGHRRRRAGIVELAVGKIGAGVALVAAGAAGEELEATLCRGRVERRYGLAA